MTGSRPRKQWARRVDIGAFLSTVCSWSLLGGAANALVGAAVLAMMFIVCNVVPSQGASLVGAVFCASMTMLGFWLGALLGLLSYLGSASEEGEEEF